MRSRGEWRGRRRYEDRRVEREVVVRWGEGRGERGGTSGSVVAP